MQIETETIGIIYAEGKSGLDNDADNTGTPGIKFIPEHPELEIDLNSSGGSMGIEAKSFGTLGGESPVFSDYHSLETAVMHKTPSTISGDIHIKWKWRILWRSQVRFGRQTLSFGNRNPEIR